MKGISTFIKEARELPAHFPHARVPPGSTSIHVGTLTPHAQPPEL